MGRQVLHKVSAIVMLLAMFTLPFYFARNQISSLNDNAFMVGAVTKSNAFTPAQSAQDNSTGNVTSMWASVAGNTFTDARIK